VSLLIAISDTKIYKAMDIAKYLDKYLSTLLPPHTQYTVLAYFIMINYFKFGVIK